MNRAAILSNNEREFIKKALQQDQRIDGRKPYEYRALDIQFALDDSSATVKLGNTKIMAVVTAEISEPYPDRPSEGTIQFRVEFSPMAAPEFEIGRPGEAAVEVGRIIERSLRDSRALDTESLVILSGMKVWHVKCDIHVMDHDGNLTDACALAALAALTAFRRPDVTIGGATGKEVTIHPVEEKEPVPLTIHHIPLAVTIGLFEDGTVVAVDPNLKEEMAMRGHVTCVLNKQEELCSIQKGGGVGVPLPMVEHCLSIAAQKVAELSEALNDALKKHHAARVQARVRRHAVVKVEAEEPDGAPTTGKGQWRSRAVAMRMLKEPTVAGNPAPGDSDYSEGSSEDDEEAQQGMGAEEFAGEHPDDEEEEGTEHTDSDAIARSASGGTLPQGALLMPSVLKAAGLSTGLKSEKSPTKTKKAKKARQPKAVDMHTDAFEDIAAVIAEAAAKQKGTKTDSLAAAVKPKKPKSKR